MRILFGVAIAATLTTGWFAAPAGIKAKASGFMTVCEDTAAEVRAGIDALVDHFAGPDIDPV